MIGIYTDILISDTCIKNYKEKIGRWGLVAYCKKNGKHTVLA
jgi:hypothetical protein